jgi:inner membrane protein COX18
MLEVGHLGPAVASKTLAQKTRAKRNEIFARGRCPLWMNYSNLIQIPIWLTAIETIRMMCGQSRGLLGMAFGRGESLVDGVLTTGLPVEEAFATEGMLWFPNLLAADPHLVLPFMLSGIIFLNIGNGNGKSLWQIRLSRSLKVVALAVGPLTLHVPSAMLVYWISSSLFGYLQGIILDWAMPMKKAVKPCITNRRRLMIPLKQDPPMRK